jgi:hypothetical protein
MDYPAKLVMGIITADDCNEPELFRVITERFGVIDIKSDSIVFDVTDYYVVEMGKKLKRQWVSFESLISQDSLSTIKIETVKMEHSFKRADGTRTVNLDPGYATMHNFVLASTKGYSHRIYLSNNIYAELTFVCKKKKFRPLNWTYFDYRDNIALFNSIRIKFKSQICPTAEKEITNV